MSKKHSWSGWPATCLITHFFLPAKMSLTISDSGAVLSKLSPSRLVLATAVSRSPQEPESLVLYIVGARQVCGNGSCWMS